MPKTTIPNNYYYSSRFEVPGPVDSLVRIPPDRVNESENDSNNKIVGRRGVEPPIPAMSRRYPNQARPPARHTMKKFVAQIYVVDRL